MEHFLEPVFEPAREAALIGLGEVVPHSAAAEYAVMLISVGLAVAGIWWARRWYVERPDAPARLVARARWAYNLSRRKFYVDETYDLLVVRPTLATARAFWKWFDIPVVDGIVNGTAGLLGWLGQIFRRVQTGLVGTYALVMALGVAAIVGWMVWGL